MHQVAHIGLPLIIVLAMTIVGLELTVADLRRVLQYPAHVAIALAGQVLLLPLVAAALILLLDVEPAVAGGLILVAAAPQAIVSNYFCLLARADVALAVTLTAVSNVLALLTTSVIASLGFRLLLERQAGIVLPVGAVMQQVVLGLLLPMAAGMVIRRFAPDFVARNRARLQGLNLAALALFIAILLYGLEGSLRSLLSVLTVALLFTAAALALGLLVAWGLSWPRTERIAMLAAYPARSLSVATLVAINVLGRLEFLSFAVVFFLVQAALLVPLMLLARPRDDAP
jgi:BASS family bile acid:Na+ symporter